MTDQAEAIRITRDYADYWSKQAKQNRTNAVFRKRAAALTLVADLAERAGALEAALRHAHEPAETHKGYPTMQSNAVQDYCREALAAARTKETNPMPTKTHTSDEAVQALDTADHVALEE